MQRTSLTRALALMLVTGVLAVLGAGCAAQITSQPASYAPAGGPGAISAPTGDGDNPDPAPGNGAVEATLWLQRVSEAYTTATPGGTAAWLVAHAPTKHKNKKQKKAIVFGIDNVTLQTHYAWPRPVPETLQLARLASQLGYSVFYVTGRFGLSNLTEVRNDMRKAGFPRPNEICGGDPATPEPVRKAACRAVIKHAGFRIAAVVAADQESFQVGDIGKLQVRLPSLPKEPA